MIHLLFVGDGERDAVTVPRLVEGILGISIREETRRWARLHRAGRGYDRKLKFAFRLVRVAEAEGLVATVDHDEEKKKRARLRTMQQVREAERREFPPLPTALGQAVPHGEAWLLDDPVAVRQALKLPNDTQIPTVSKTKDPKKALESLLAESKRAGERYLHVWADIAREVDPERCVHSKETGFEAFADDVRDELGALAVGARSDQ